MGDGFLGLGHHGVIGRNNDNGQVRHLGTAGTHGRKGLVAGGIQEGDAAAVFQFYAVGANVLGNATGLTGNHVGVADVVQQGGLTMVHMTHHGDYRRAFHQVFLLVGLLLLHFFGEFCRDEFHLVAEFFGHKDQGFCIQALVDGHHHAQGHAGANHLHHRGVVHQGGQVVHGHKLGYLQDLVLCSGGFHFFLRTDGGNFAFLLAVLGAKIVLALVHAGVGFLHLLLDFLLQFFLLGLRHSRFKALALLGRLCFFVVLFLLGGFFCLYLGNVYLLGAAALDALTFFGALGVELGQVNLAQHLEGCRAFLGCRGFRGGRGGFRLCFGLRFCDRFGFGLRLHNGVGFCYRFGLRFRFRFRFRFYHGFGFRFHNWLRLYNRLGFRFHYRFRLRLCHGLGLCNNGAGQVVVLDNGYPFGLKLVFFVVLFPRCLVQDFGELDVHLLGLFLELQVFSELLVQFRHVFVGNLQVGIGVFNAGAFGVEEIHQGVQPDVELFDKFR